MKSDAILEKLETLASQAEKELMLENTMRMRAAQLCGYIEGLRDAMKLLEGENNV